MEFNSLTPGEWAAIALALYEILSRIIKTNKTWSLIGKILLVLTQVSDKLDRNTLKK